MEMTEDERRARLINWLEEIKHDLSQLVRSEHIFWELQKIVEQNENFRESSGLFTRWIADGFQASSVIAVRRQIKLQDSSISMRGLLEEVKKSPHLVSRSHFISLFNVNEPLSISLGMRTFDRMAGVGVDCIPLAHVEQHIADLKSSAAKIENYADKRIAHFDRKEPARPFPTFDDLSAAIKVLEQQVIYYWRFLKGASMSELLPTILLDWHDVFKFPWKPD